MKGCLIASLSMGILLIVFGIWLFKNTSGECATNKPTGVVFSILGILLIVGVFVSQLKKPK